MSRSSIARLSFDVNRTELDNSILAELISLKKTRLRTYKSLFVLSVAFLLQFTAFVNLEDLQSSVNTESNAGLNSLLIIYAVFIFSALFLPCPMIALLGLKWTLVISQVPYLLYVAANFYPKDYLLYPASALVGLAAAPLWASVGSYLTDAATLYAEKSQHDVDLIVNRFFGIFYTFFQSGSIWGSLISYLLIQAKQETYGNDTQTCGANFNGQEYASEDSNNEIDRTTINTLCIAYVCVCACSIFIVIVFLDQRRQVSRDKVSVVLRESAALFLATIKQLRHGNQLLLIPLTIWVGLEQSYISAQFTQGFISCVLNAKYVGLVMLAHGICDVLVSISIGQVVKVINRWICFVIAALINYALLITMLVWQPSVDSMAVLFVIAGLWGVTDGVWQTQLNAFYALTFADNDKAAFSNYRLWESVGFVFLFAITPYIRIRVSLIILIVVLSLGIGGYGVAEYRCRTKTSNDCSLNQVHPT